MRFNSLILASAIVLLAATGVNSADAIIAQEPVQVSDHPAFTWGGAYIGVQIGYGKGKSVIEDSTATLKPDGFLGGVYAGYNFDAGSKVIFGVDGDVTYNHFKDVDYEDFMGSTFGLKSELRWSGAVRVRAGVAVDRFLPYIAAGAAFGQLKTSMSLSTDGETLFNAADSKTLSGWTLGAGVDYAATDNLIVRLEYRYTDYGSKEFNPEDRDFAFIARNKLTTSDIRLGVAINSDLI